MPKKQPAKQQPKLIQINYKRYAMITGAIIASITIYKFGSDMTQRYVERIAQERITEELKAFPPPENVRTTQADIREIKSKLETVSIQIEGIDQYLRGRGVKP